MVILGNLPYKTAFCSSVLAYVDYKLPLLIMLICTSIYSYQIGSVSLIDYVSIFQCGGHIYNYHSLHTVNLMVGLIKHRLQHVPDPSSV